jgi:hypothetical protein
LINHNNSKLPVLEAICFQIQILPYQIINADGMASLIKWLMPWNASHDNEARVLLHFGEHKM